MQNNVILKSLLHPMLGVCLLLVGMMIVPQLAQANAGMVIAAEQDGKIYNTQGKSAKLIKSVFKKG